MPTGWMRSIGSRNAIQGTYASHDVAFYATWNPVLRLIVHRTKHPALIQIKLLLMQARVRFHDNRLLQQLFHLLKPLPVVGL
jgi:hypothetical protein